MFFGFVCLCRTCSSQFWLQMTSRCFARWWFRRTWSCSSKPSESLKKKTVHGRKTQTQFCRISKHAFSVWILHIKSVCRGPTRVSDRWGWRDDRIGAARDENPGGSPQVRPLCLFSFTCYFLFQKHWYAGRFLFSHAHSHFINYLGPTMRLHGWCSPWNRFADQSVSSEGHFLHPFSSRSNKRKTTSPFWERFKLSN